MTLCRRLRVLARSRQGLLDQSKQLDELLSKVLKDKLAKGIVGKIQNDFVNGGLDQTKAVQNYTHIIHKF